MYDMLQTLIDIKNALEANQSIESLLDRVIVDNTTNQECYNAYVTKEMNMTMRNYIENETTIESDEYTIATFESFIDDMTDMQNKHNS